MELCVDNPRSGFADLFATHPSVQARVDALVQFAGGHDPGPLPELPARSRPTIARRRQLDAAPAPAPASGRRAAGRLPWGRAS